MQLESLYGKLYNNDKIKKIIENLDFCAKFNQEFSIRMVSLTSSSRDEENVK